MKSPVLLKILEAQKRLQRRHSQQLSLHAHTYYRLRYGLLALKNAIVHLLSELITNGCVS